MRWLPLLAAFLLLLIGIVGQLRDSRQRSRVQQVDRHALRRIIFVGSIVIGLWLLIFIASHLLHFSTFGHENRAALIFFSTRAALC